MAKDLWRRLLEWRRQVEEPFDYDFPDSAPRIDSDFGCPDTQPTSPGALDSDLARLECRKPL